MEPNPRFVAVRYSEMQGLRKVVDGVSILVLWIIMRAWYAADVGTFLFFSVIWGLCTMWAVSVAGRYYAARFGRPAPAGILPDDGPVMLAYAPFRLLLISAFLSWGGWFALVVPMLALAALNITWRDWPHRPYWMLLVIVGAVFSLAVPLGPKLVPSWTFVHDWPWRLICVAAPALVIVGLFDHYVLMRALNRAPDVFSETAHADTL